MKNLNKNITIILFIGFMMSITSCTQYTCPTYARSKTTKAVNRN